MFVPLVQPDISSVIFVLEDSSLDPSIPSPIIPAPLSTPLVTIKDKASDLGLKDITDKDSWIDAKKIIDACLRRPPYCPGPDSKVLVTVVSRLDMYRTKVLMYRMMVFMAHLTKVRC